MAKTQTDREDILVSALESWLEETREFPLIYTQDYLHHDVFKSNEDAIDYLIRNYFELLADVDKIRLKKEFLYNFPD